VFASSDDAFYIITYIKVDMTHMHLVEIRSRYKSEGYIFGLGHYAKFTSLGGFVKIKIKQLFKCEILWQ